MITVLPLKDKDKLAELYMQNGQTAGEASEAVVAADGEETLGFCLFDIDKDNISIGTIQPVKDLSLADGVLRTALHVAVSRGIMKAVYTENAPKDVLEQLGFVENDETRGVKIEKLFSICQNCK